MRDVVVSDMIGSRPRVAESADVVNLGSRDLANCLSRSDILMLDLLYHATVFTFAGLKLNEIHACYMLLFVGSEPGRPVAVCEE